MKWFLVQQAIGEPDIDVREEDEDLSRGFSLMRELAAQGPHDNLTEIGPGAWIERGGPGNSGPGAVGGL